MDDVLEIHAWNLSLNLKRYVVWIEHSPFDYFELADFDLRLAQADLCLELILNFARQRHITGEGLGSVSVLKLLVEASEVVPFFELGAQLLEVSN